jgi:hypothetical protein
MQCYKVTQTLHTVQELRELALRCPNGTTEAVQQSPIALGLHKGCETASQIQRRAL